MSVVKTLVLGCGPHWPKRNDAIYEDTFLDVIPFSGVDIVHDLNITPWPIADASFTSISAIHVVEHLQNLVKFMDECHRILTPGGSVYIETPLAGADPDLQWADPTHVRCYRKHTFINYFTPGHMEKFGYTTKAWCPLHIDVRDNCIIFHGAVIK